MKAEQLTAAKLAEIVQVQPSSISHLLSGRNKPNFEFVARMLRMFPELNPDWLINGIGAMYRNSSADSGESVTKSQDTAEEKTKQLDKQSVPFGLFDDTTVMPAVEQKADFTPIAQEPESKLQQEEPNVIYNSSLLGDDKTNNEPNSRASASVQRVVLLFDDQTFSVYEGGNASF